MPLLRDHIMSGKRSHKSRILDVRRVKDNGFEKNPFFLVSVLERDKENPFFDVVVVGQGFNPSVGDVVEFEKTKSAFLTMILVQSKEEVNAESKKNSKKSKSS